MLLGVSGAGKSSIGNAILGRETFKESRTRESEKQTGRVEDRNISIIDTPGFFNTHLTDEELQNEMVRSMYLCYPGPHVFLLVINLETFREEQRNIVEQIQENLRAQVWSEFCAKIIQTNAAFCKQTRSALQRNTRLANKQKAICKYKSQFERKPSGVNK